MLELRFQKDDLSGAMTFVQVFDNASADDLAHAFGLIALAFGLNKVHVIVECESQDAQKYAFQDWAAGEESPIHDVFAELEADKHSSLLFLIMNSWPRVMPATVRAWATGYLGNGQLAGELALLANILEEIGD